MREVCVNKKKKGSVWNIFVETGIEKQVYCETVKPNLWNDVGTM